MCGHDVAKAEELLKGPDLSEAWPGSLPSVWEAGGPGPPLAAPLPPRGAAAVGPGKHKRSWIIILGSSIHLP